MENDLNSSYEFEIAQRNHILKKVYNGIKITPEERLWLVTHSVYNEQFGANAFNIVIEQLIPNTWYLLKIKVESIFYDNRIIPIISVPGAKGKIITPFELRKYSGEIAPKKETKVLAFESVGSGYECEVEYFSKLGLLSVNYGCDYFDQKQNLHMRKASSTGDPDFAMTREVVNDHTVRYNCKSPIGSSFDALVFSIEWTNR